MTLPERMEELYAMPPQEIHYVENFTDVVPLALSVSGAQEQGIEGKV